MDLTSVGTRLFFSQPQREARDTARSAVASAVFHLVIVLALLWATRASVQVLTGADQGVGDGIGAGAAGGGGGGGRDEEVSILIPEPPPQTPAEVALVIPEKVEEIPVEEPKVEEPVTIAKADTVPQPAATPAPPTGGTGTGEGTGQGPGTGPGTGPGSGGGSGGGEGGGIGSGIGPGTGRGRIMTPSPEVLLIPPSAPGSVKGKAVVVRLAVDSIGSVRDAEIIPSTGDRKFDSALKRVALGWKFRPARDAANRPISVLFDVTFTF